MLHEKYNIDLFKNTGAIVLRGVFKEWVQPLKEGIKFLMENPSPRERSYTPSDGTAPFFQDLCNWQRVQEFKNFIYYSPAAETACKLMNSKSARFFHDHVLVKEPGSSMVTPWHQDQPYYCTEGFQSVSFWIPLDKITKKISINCISGSHLWGKVHKPKRFDGTDLFENDKNEEVPDIDNNKEDYEILSWDMDPGDAVAFNFRTLHGANANSNQNQRRRVFSARWVGEDAKFVDRKGKGSPPFNHLKLKTGEPLSGKDFPLIYSR